MSDVEAALDAVMREAAGRWGEDASEGPYCRQEILEGLREILGGLRGQGAGDAETVQVVLTGESYGEPATFETYEAYPVIPRPVDVFDVHRAQHERWVAAKAAFDAMQEEIEGLLAERYRNAPVRKLTPPR